MECVVYLICSNSLMTAYADTKQLEAALNSEKNQYAPEKSHCLTGEIPSSLSMTAVMFPYAPIRLISRTAEVVEIVSVGQETRIPYVDGSVNSGYPIPVSWGPKGSTYATTRKINAPNNRFPRKARRTRTAADFEASCIQPKRSLSSGSSQFLIKTIRPA